MKEKLELLLVEDDQEACKQIINAVADNPDDFTLIGITNNSARAFQYVTECFPDAVILDLELHRGGGDGLEFLQRLKEVHLPRTPFILVTTNNISAVTHEIARELGADFIMTKNQENYSAQSVLTFLKTTKSVILNRREQAKGQPIEETPTQIEKRLQRRVCSELNKIGISQKSIGYQYLVDAIILTVQQPVSRICNVLGEKYRKTESSVERAMQNAINRAWKTSDINDLLTNYTAKIKCDKGAPTITEFIFYYAHKINYEY